MKICMIGTGYVGLVSGTCLADMGNDVICVDSDAQKIASLNQGEINIFEPGLVDLVGRNAAQGRLTFTTDIAYGVVNSLIIFIAVGTPAGGDESADLSEVKAAARSVGRAMDGKKIVVIKSTVPVGTAQLVAETISEETDRPFVVVSNPEFLKEGTAVEDFMRPERVVIGTEDEHAAELMKELYAPYTRTGNPIFVMDTRSAELSKYAANALLATRISFMNEMANLCDRLGADVDAVRRAVAADSRIGPKFLFSGVGFGGSCLPKDLAVVIGTAEDHNCPADITRAVKTVNDRQREIFVEKIRTHFGGKIEGLTLTLWGLSFKPNTDDVRDAPALFITERLLGEGVSVAVFDPTAMDKFRVRFGDRVHYAANAYEALAGADALCLITEWNEFRNPDFERMKGLMKRPVIFDGRNQYNRDELEGLGFTYYCFGRPGRAAKR
jgi:UDPglucose 6-dehydrogenase